MPSASLTSVPGGKRESLEKERPSLGRGVPGERSFKQTGHPQIHGPQWRTEEVPEDWRKANVTPVFKKGKKEEPLNYRPVSLTSIPGKVMEQLILEVIIKQLEEKKLSGVVTMTDSFL